MKEFDKQIAVITGAASGIGLAIARGLKSEGAFLILLDINDELLLKEFGNSPNAKRFPISASKAALIGMTKVQGKEYAESGITINALAPAVIKTALVEAMPVEQVKYMTDKIPMKRCGTLEEVVNMALYIVSVKNRFTTGFTFDLSGGRATY